MDKNVEDWQRDVSHQLLLNKKLLQNDVAMLRNEVNDLCGQRRCLLIENDTLKVKCKAMRAEMKQFMTVGNKMRVKGSPKYLLVGLIFIVLVNDVVLLTLFS